MIRSGLHRATADRDLALSSRTARQEHVGDVAARDQQQQSYRRRHVYSVVLNCRLALRPSDDRTANCLGNDPETLAPSGAR